MEKTERAFAKLNICLAVGDCMSDGYHRVQTIMQSVSLCDELRIAVEDRPGEVSLSTDMPFLPTDDRNLAVRAAKLFYLRLGMIRRETRIDIKKHIPVGAGLAGGSTDVAAVLRALNELFKTELSQKQLEELGGELGTDVPYCIAGGTVLASGRGEKLQTISPLPEVYAVICKPVFAISTPELFRQFDRVRPKRFPDIEGAVRAIEQGDMKALGRLMFNVFEEVLPPKYKEVAEIKSRLLDYAPFGCCMTGTGSAVYALFKEETAAAAACAQLKKSYKDCFLCRTVQGLPVK